MHSSPAADPIARFRAIYHALSAESRWWGDETWLRFAAQAAVIAPGDPRVIAAAILSMAKTFSADAGWIDPLRSPLRFVVASILMQIGDNAADFEAELVRVRQLFHATGIFHGGINAIMAVLLLRLTSNRQPITLSRIERLHGIYIQLKGRHWWLIGPHDLPACALLAYLPGTPEAIGRTVEEYYLRLRKDGFMTGRHLELAAHILPLTRLPALQTVHRYGALVHRFATHDSLPWQDNYEAIAVLGLLDQDTTVIVARTHVMYAQLDELQPHLQHRILIALAADLTFLDLCEQRQRGLKPGDHGAQQDLHRTIRDAQAASAIVACFESTAIDPASY